MKLKKAIVIALLVIPAGSFFISNDVSLPVNEREKACLIEAAWHEARGESEDGIRAVMAVIQNRVHSRRYPASYCAVIYQYRQFSYVIEHKRIGKSTKPVVKPSEMLKYRLIERLAVDTLQAKLDAPVPPDVLWYHTHQVKPQWSKKKKLVKVVGKHRFFTERKS